VKKGGNPSYLSNYDADEGKTEDRFRASTHGTPNLNYQ
jgi:hypothetical protein